MAGLIKVTLYPIIITYRPNMRTLFPVAVILLILFALPGFVVFAADLLGYGPELNSSLESMLGISHRIALGVPAASLLFLVPLLIILLYFLRLKRKPVPVPSTFLWKKSIEDLHVNRLMQWLRRNVLLLLQLLAAMSMIYGVLGPRLHGAVVGGRHYILIIDHSASMSATDVKPTRLDWAKSAAIHEIDAATDSDIGMVIVFSDVAEIRQSYTSNREELRKAIESIRPTNRPTRLDEALSLAASLANPENSAMNEAVAPANPEPGKERSYVAIDGLQAEVHLYSDGRFPPVADFALANLNLVFHAPPIPDSGDGTSDNVGILRVDAERDADDPTRVVVSAVIRNFKSTASEARPRLELLEGGSRLLATYDDDESRRTGRRTAIPARTEIPDLTFTIPEIAENNDLVLKLTLDGVNDAFSADDQAWIVLGVVRKAQVLVVGPENARLRDFLDSPSTKKLADVSYLPASVLAPTADPKLYTAPAREGKYDLVIFDRCGPTADAMPASNTFFIGYPPPPFVLGTGVEANVAQPINGAIVRGWNSRHPVMRGLQALDTITAAEAFRLPDLPPRTQRLIEGDRNLVLLAAIPRQVHTDLVLAFPILTNDGKWNTNWPLKVSYPLFLRNVLLSLGNVREASSEEALKPGEVKYLRLGGVRELHLTKPGGAAVRLERGSRAAFAFSDTDELGVYSLQWTEPGSNSMMTRRFAVNLFDEQESNLAPVPNVSVGNTVVSSEEPQRMPRDLWKWPVLTGLLVLVLEWWIYNRRVQI